MENCCIYLNGPSSWFWFSKINLVKEGGTHPCYALLGLFWVLNQITAYCLLAAEADTWKMGTNLGHLDHRYRFVMPSPSLHIANRRPESAFINIANHTADRNEGQGLLPTRPIWRLLHILWYQNQKAWIRRKWVTWYVYLRNLILPRPMDRFFMRCCGTVLLRVRFLFIVTILVPKLHRLHN